MVPLLRPNRLVCIKLLSFSQQKFGDYQQSLGCPLQKQVISSREILWSRVDTVLFRNRMKSVPRNIFVKGDLSQRYVAGLLLLFFDPATCFKAPGPLCWEPPLTPRDKWSRFLVDMVHFSRRNPSSLLWYKEVPFSLLLY